MHDIPLCSFCEHAPSFPLVLQYDMCTVGKKIVWEVFLLQKYKLILPQWHKPLKITFSLCSSSVVDILSLKCC